MKTTTTTQAKNGRPTPATKTQKTNEDAFSTPTGNISKIKYYDPVGGHCGCGVGFIDDQLVEFWNNDESSARFNEITLIDAVEWMKAMQFAEVNLGICSNCDDDAMIKFLDLVLEKIG